MLTRRHLRIKVMQSLYAYLQQDTDISQVEKQLLKRIDRIYDLYLLILDVFFEVSDNMRVRMEEAKKKHFPTQEDLNPNLRFVHNVILLSLEKNTFILDAMKKRKITWRNEETYIRKVFNEIKNSEELDSYLHKSSSSIEDDRKILEVLLEKYIINQGDLQSVFEEKDINWSDDIENAFWLVLKTFQLVEQSPDQSISIPGLFKVSTNPSVEDDQAFMLSLLRKTAVNKKYYQELISEKTKNWDVDRIAQMDVLLMMMAISEFIDFPDIPIKVSMNEYIEIAKEYSTPKSQSFINGVLDKILPELKAEGRIIKSPKGLK